MSIAKVGGSAEEVGGSAEWPTPQEKNWFQEKNWLEVFEGSAERPTSQETREEPVQEKNWFDRMFAMCEPMCEPACTPAAQEGSPAAAASSAVHPQPSNLNPQPSTLCTQHAILNLQPSTPTPQPSTLNPPTCQTEDGHVQEDSAKRRPAAFGASQPNWLVQTSSASLKVQREREWFIDNLLVRIHCRIVMIRWTGLAPWEFDRQ